MKIFLSLISRLDTNKMVKVKKNIQKSKFYGGVLNDNENMLLNAVQLEDIKSVTDLLEKGTNVNIQDENKSTPLHLAAANGNIQIINELLKIEDINVNAQDEDGRTPLHMAVVNNHLNCIKKLLQYRYIQINTKDNEGRTPLHEAVYDNYFDGVKSLLSAKNVSLDILDDDKNTPYMLALEFKSDKQDEDENKKNEKIKKLFETDDISQVRLSGGKPKSKMKSSKETILYARKKYTVHIGSRGGKYILVGAKKKKIYVK